MIGESIYLVVKNKIYKYQNNTFQSLIDFSTTNYAGAMHSEEMKKTSSQ